ncbi:uncharacterized protein [Euphorbia lathyris]|uniref:uncharacterized protein n=1 Tax=Euphorbia lathyris TaxID=212925 RepID=UPI0033135903
MKRGRISTIIDSNAKRGRKETAEVRHIQTQASIPDLPKDILVNILLRLSSSKNIFVCKCVCRTWYDIISEAEFAKHINVVKEEFYPHFGSNSGCSFSSYSYSDSSSETDSEDIDIVEEKDIVEEDDIYEEDDVVEEEELDDEDDIVAEDDLFGEDDIVAEDEIVEEEDVVLEELYPSSDSDLEPTSDSDSYI